MLYKMRQFRCFFFGAGGSSAATIACDIIRFDPLACSRIAHLIEDVLELVLRERGALDVLDSSQLSCHLLTILSPNRGHLLLAKLLSNAVVIPKIGLGSNDEAGDAGAVVVNFREPLLTDVLKGGW